ncbi:hypothetical protein Bca4012_084153 [Brassica carinata]
MPGCSERWPHAPALVDVVEVSFWERFGSVMSDYACPGRSETSLAGFSEISCDFPTYGASGIFYWRGSLTSSLLKVVIGVRAWPDSGSRVAWRPSGYPWLMRSGREVPCPSAGPKMQSPVA